MPNITPLTIALTDANGGPQSVAVPPGYLAPVQVNAAAGFPLPIVAATPGMIVRVYRAFLVVGGATTITFRDGAALYPQIVVAEPNETIMLDPQLFPWFQTSIGDALNLDSTNNVQITGAVWVNLNAT